MRVEGQQLSELAVGHEGQPDVVVTGSSEDFCDMFWGDLNPSEKYMSGEITLAGLAAGRHADRRHLHGGLPRHLSPPHTVTDATLASRATLRRALGLRTVVTTSTGLAFAALEYLAAAGLVAYVAGDSAFIPIIVAGLLALVGLRLLRRAQRDVPHRGRHPPLHEAVHGRPCRARPSRSPT